MTKPARPLYEVTPNGLVLSLTVRPKSSRNHILGVFDQQLKIALQAPPIEGQANEACQIFLAKVFAVRRSDIKYLQGETSRTKRVAIQGNPQQLESILQHILKECADV